MGFNLAHRNKYGETPLIHAARIGSLKCVDMFRGRADFACTMNRQDTVEGNTALHYAVQREDRRMIEVTRAFV